MDNDEQPNIYGSTSDIYWGALGDNTKKSLPMPLEQNYDFMTNMLKEPAYSEPSLWGDYADGIHFSYQPYYKKRTLPMALEDYPTWAAATPTAKGETIFYDGINNRYWAIPKGVKSVRNYINMHVVDESMPPIDF